MGHDLPSGFKEVLDVIAEEVRRRHEFAYLDRPTETAHRDLWMGGEYQWRREGEPHLFDPETVFRLHNRLLEGQKAQTRLLRVQIFLSDIADIAAYYEQHGPAKAAPAPHTGGDVYDAETMQFQFEIRPYEDFFTGGVRVAVADMLAFDRLYKRLTDAVPIKNVTSHFAMERMKFTTAYPVDTRSR